MHCQGKASHRVLCLGGGWGVITAATPPEGEGGGGGSRAGRGPGFRSSKSESASMAATVARPRGSSILNPPTPPPPPHPPPHPLAACVAPLSRITTTAHTWLCTVLSYVLTPRTLPCCHRSTQTGTRTKTNIQREYDCSNGCWSQVRITAVDGVRDVALPEHLLA